MNMPRYLTEKDEQNREVLSINPEYEAHLKKKKFASYVSLSDIPKEYWKLSFKDYIGNKSVQAKIKIEAYAKECATDKFLDVNLYLYGPNSTQKTMLACAAGKYFIHHGYYVKFVLSGHLIHKLLQLQRYNPDPEDVEFVEECKQCDLLIIDDAFDVNKNIMWNNSSHLIISAWDTFLRDKISNHRRIIMTSNIDINQVSVKYGRSMYTLIDRNFYPLYFEDSITDIKKTRLIDPFEKIPVFE